eukprot:CAMPEP_0117443190 /NCGR_PEP_ID=MMETSP0759-20121206/4563_1 /TAXON_ID=63605 /ORGANISM="Percolomonas cosmopolitus, Strain WS" /LENGTH=234 /DNA_ID=CAMNT_0005235149 /DNA_START=248 /DNA_END=952 /DNA_ORIENTATION=-
MPLPSNQLTASPDMCAHCFDHLLFSLNGHSSEYSDNHHLSTTPQTPTITSSVTPSFPNEKTPLFVTWEKFSHSQKEYQLRGCIGTFSKPKLHEGLSTYATIAAFQDSRFSPIQFEEVKLLKCSINLLVNFEWANDVFDWEPGTHGIHIFFRHPVMGRDCSATYLPSVMSDMNWGHNDALSSLYRKAGWKGEITKKLMQQTRLERYQSSKCELTYEEYVEKYQNGRQGLSTGKMS